MAGEERNDEGSYRWRLARAAAASCALHMLLFGGLSVSTLDLENTPTESLQAREPRKPKRPAADFRLEVPRSAEKPMHERPLDVPLTPTEQAAPKPRERPPERNVASRQEQPFEEATPISPSPPTLDPERSRETAITPAVSEAPDRQAEVTPSEAAPTAEMANMTPAAATPAPAASAPAPAAMSPLVRPGPARVAARWRPREVALLEQLSATAPAAAALAARDALPTATPGSTTPLQRRTMPAARPTSDARAVAAAAPATTTAAAQPTVAPAIRETARRSSSQTATAQRPAPSAGELAQDTRPSPTSLSGVAPTLARSSRPSGGTTAAAVRSPLSRQTAAPTAGSSGAQAAMPAAVAMPASASTAGNASGTASGPIAPAPSGVASAGGGRTGPRASALGGSRQAAAGGAPDQSGSQAAAIATGSMGQASGVATAQNLRGGGTARGGGTSGSGDAEGLASQRLARDSGGAQAGLGNPGRVATLGHSPAASTTTGSAATAGGGTTGAGVGDQLGPAQLDRGRRGTASRSALSSRGGVGRAMQSDAGEGLSISPADLKILGVAGRRRAGLPERPAGPRSPERIAAAALDTDSRVRDVAKAFATRTPAGGQAAGGIDSPKTLDRSRAMVDRGLGFLARSQRADGRWRLTEFAGVTEADRPKLESDTAATGLALLCFFGAGHDHFDGAYHDTIRRGLEFLISVQKADGDLFLPADDLSNSCGWLYSHGIASIALCEAVGMTGDPRVKPAAAKALGFVAASRHPTLGGWRYTPRSDADLSVSGWMLVALRAGDLAGVKTDPAALDGVRTLLAASASPSDPTRFAYNARKSEQRQTDLSVACMTAVGMLMRLHTGATADEAGIVAAGRVLADFRPTYGSREQNLRDAYLWYYASQALVHTGGEGWQRWYASLVDTLEPEQQLTGPLAGSWDATGNIPDRWGIYGGRVYVTALHLLALEVPWRHLPTFATAPIR